MENGNKDQLKSSFKQGDQQKAEKGPNDWNDRLDENLEPEAHNDEPADEKARDYSERFGSGDQSDANKS